MYGTLQLPAMVRRGLRTLSRTSKMPWIHIQVKANRPITFDGRGAKPPGWIRVSLLAASSPLWVKTAFPLVL